MKNFEKIIKNINLNQGWSFIEKYHKYHTFHLVNPSPWPFTTAFGLLYTTFGSVLYFHYYELGSTFFFLGFFFSSNFMHYNSRKLGRRGCRFCLLKRHRRWLFLWVRVGVGGWYQP